MQDIDCARVTVKALKSDHSTKVPERGGGDSPDLDVLLGYPVEYWVHLRGSAPADRE